MSRALGWIGAAVLFALAWSTSALAADNINGRVTGAGAPIAGSTVTLWSASAGAPKQLAQARTGADGRFAVPVPRGSSVLYLFASGGRPAANPRAGDNPAIALLAVVGTTPPARVTINEMTTVASVWTHAQFIEGTAIRGHSLGLNIYTNPNTGKTTSYGAAREGNTVYADEDGNTYRSTPGGWQQHTSSGWQSASGDMSWANREQQARSEGEDRFNSFGQSGAGRWGGGSGWGDRSSGGWNDRFNGGFSSGSWNDRFNESGGRFGGYRR